MSFTRSGNVGRFRAGKNNDLLERGMEVFGRVSFGQPGRISRQLATWSVQQDGLHRDIVNTQVMVKANPNYT